MAQDLNFKTTTSSLSGSYLLRVTAHLVILSKNLENGAVATLKREFSTCKEEAAFAASLGGHTAYWLV